MSCPTLTDRIQASIVGDEGGGMGEGWDTHPYQEDEEDQGD